MFICQIVSIILKQTNNFGILSNILTIFALFKEILGYNSDTEFILFGIDFETVTYMFIITG